MLVREVVKQRIMMQALRTMERAATFSSILSCLGTWHLSDLNVKRQLEKFLGAAHSQGITPCRWLSLACGYCHNACAKGQIPAKNGVNNRPHDGTSRTACEQLGYADPHKGVRPSALAHVCNRAPISRECNNVTFDRRVIKKEYREYFTGT